MIKDDELQEVVVIKFYIFEASCPFGVPHSVHMPMGPRELTHLRREEGHANGWTRGEF